MELNLLAVLVSSVTQANTDSSFVNYEFSWYTCRILNFDSPASRRHLSATFREVPTLPYFLSRALGPLDAQDVDM